MTDEGAIIERFRLSQGVSPPAGGQRPPLRANRNISERAGEDTRPYEKRESSGFAVGADNLGGPRAHTVRPYGMAWAARPGGRALRASWFMEGGRPHGAAPTAGTTPGALVRQSQAQLWSRNSDNFCIPRAQWPGLNSEKPLHFCAPEIFSPAKGITPVTGVRG